MATTGTGPSAWQFWAKPSLRTILLVVPPHEWPTEALLRADELARALGGSLFLVKVERRGLRRGGPAHRAFEDASLWAGSVLGISFSENRVVVAAGRLVPTVLGVARDLGAGLVVLPQGKEGAALRLARRAQVPVLVARAGRSGAAVLAATDLRDPADLVVRYGAELGERLAEPVVLVNNVAPAATPLVMDDFAAAIPVEPSDAEVAEHRERLERLAHEVGRDGVAIVETRATAAEGVLDAARFCGADLVVVGTHSRSWVERLVQDSAAGDVVRRSSQSVVVVPLPGHPAR